jgi:hypothetical protein
MSARHAAAHARRVIWLIAATAMLALLSYATLQTRSGAWVMLWQRANLASFAHDSGHAYSSPTGVPDQSSHQRPSPAHVFEDGRLLGPANATKESIRELGAGRYAFWHDAVFFSASDNSDPARNGRLYVIAYPPITRTVARVLYGATVLLTFATAIVVIGLIRAAGIDGVMAELSAAGTRMVALTPSMRTVDPFMQRRLRAATFTLWAVVVLLVGASETVLQTRTGSWTRFWREAPIGMVQAEQGFAFVGQTGRQEIGSHVSPEPTGLLENGVQLGLRNALHSEIREVGRGRYSFWHDYVLFASSDNSDPRTNGRRYVMTFPPISRQGARAVYGTTVLVFLLAIGCTWAALRAGALSVPPALAGFVRRNAIPAVSVAAGASLVLPALLRARSSSLAGDVWPLILLLHVVLAIIIRVSWGSRVPTPVLAACLLALVIGYGLLTAWAPHRTQGCHTNGESYPVWTMYCVAPDSASYYTGYTVGSTRQPLYPWFIAAVTSGTGFNPRQFLETVRAGEPRFDGDPLFRVVRAQVLLLLAASVLACAAFMRLLGSTLPAVIFLWLYDMQFFSAGELNFILTEPLVQTFQLVLVAAFAICLWQLRGGWILVAGAAAGLAYLTRQASAYSSMLLAFVIVVALLRDRRRWWKVCAAALVLFAAIASIPDVYALVKTGSLGKQQQNLQYQYRIAHAMQYATPEDLALMPDDDSRAWLREAMIRRDAAHRALEAKFADDEYNRLVYYVNDNLYVVATPANAPFKSPEFYMGVATPILAKHWREYAQFAFRFWVVALERPQVSRLGFLGFSPWVTYGLLFALGLVAGGWRGLAGIVLVLCHWAAVALACLFAAPIPRMVWASEFLVVLSLLLLVWSAGERLAPAVSRRWAAAAA